MTGKLHIPGWIFQACQLKKKKKNTNKTLPKLKINFWCIFPQDNWNKTYVRKECPFIYGLSLYFKLF